MISYMVWFEYFDYVKMGFKGLETLHQEIIKIVAWKITNKQHETNLRKQKEVIENIARKDNKRPTKKQQPTS